MSRLVYRFGGGASDGEAGNRNLLGGKGANLAEMAAIGLPVPPGFTIATPACAAYYEQGDGFRDAVADQVADRYDLHRPARVAQDGPPQHLDQEAVRMHRAHVDPHRLAAHRPGV